MIGFVAVFLALAFTAVPVAARSIGRFSRQETARGKKSEACYYIAAALIAAAVLYLGYIILTDQFQYRYVYSYSAKNLTLLYKTAAFWAGQEGSFLLWVFLHSILGLLLKRKKNIPPDTLAVHGLIQIALLLIVLIKSPFMMFAQVMTDGMGLNPLLQNPWMISHPPLLFLGYAGLAVPLALAMGSLLDRDYESWLKQALPWSLAAWAALGIGIFIGGFWAYEVLGWGGYWAWDPVENSSLIPWLAAGALVHFLLTGIRRKMALKPAYLATIFAYVTVLYGTFLTRSGILSDFSTHSFSNQGTGQILALLVMLVLLLSSLLLIAKWQNIPREENPTSLQNRASLTLIGAAVLAGLGLVVLLGTSTPLITSLLGNPQSVNASFYNITSLPFAAIIFLLLSLASLFPWKGQYGGSLKRILPLLPAALAVIALGFIFPVRGPFNLLVLGLAGLALAAQFAGPEKSFNSLDAPSNNKTKRASQTRTAKRPVKRPSLIAHIGLCCLVTGVIISSAADRKETAVLTLGEEQFMLGRSIVYLGEEHLIEGKEHRYSFIVDGASMLAPVRMEQDFTVYEPAIKRGLFKDIYLAPSLTQDHGEETYTLLSEESKLIGTDGLELRLTDVGMTEAMPGSVYATLQAILNGEYQEVRVLLVYMGEGKYEPTAQTVFDRYELSLVAAEPGEVLLTVCDQKTAAGLILVELSEKPLINLVWLGALMISIGTAWAAGKRRTSFPKALFERKAEL
ncbi:MAG: cytochrome c biogenesis protein CcsA [Clostridiales bacterium]|jgi:cytochrome c-type biogenesis protein CcmF|nr:cytochrome c biogenesis protein CcsA [Clostridiales bacterium]